MKIKNYFKIEFNNNLLYLISSLILYVVIYSVVSYNIKGFTTVFLGIFLLGSAVLFDLYLSRSSKRIFVRFFLTIALYLVLKFFISVISDLLSPRYGYNIIIDKLPFVFDRDTITAFGFIIFYFVFDSVKIKNKNELRYYFSIIIIIASLIIIFASNTLLFNTIFKNKFFLSVYLLLILSILLVRHSIYILSLRGKIFKKKDIFLFLPIFILLLAVLYLIVFPKHLRSVGSSMFDQSLFQFDFSRYLDLKDELKQSDDRVLILELEGYENKIKEKIKNGWDKQIYLKRFVLEEFTSSGIFKVSENSQDDLSPPVYVSNFKWQLKNPPNFKARKNILEILYLINIDPSSLMGSDLLYKVVPVTNWDGSKYKQIYKSYTSIFYPEKPISDILTQEKFLKSIKSSRKQMIMDFGHDKDIKALADKVTEGHNSPIEKTIDIESYLRNNYFYTLKPGYAKDGNQLKYFLFESKKGYCTYFAFAMTLMLRSQGIASRVAVGFAPDMNERTLNFYDVRSLHGHAWVEVFFDNYGWITFDPTSSNLVKGENFSFFKGDRDDRNKLIEEILKNKDKMKDINQENNGKSTLLESLKYNLRSSVRIAGVILILFLITLLILFIAIKKNINYCYYLINKDLKKKHFYYYKHVLGKLFDLGFSIKKNETILEFSERLKSNEIIDIGYLTEAFQKIMFKDKSEFILELNKLNDESKKVKMFLKNISIKEKFKSFFNISRLWKRILPLIIFLLLGFNSNLYSDINDLPKDNNKKDITEYIIEIQSAIQENYYDKALSLSDEAEKLYPENYIPNFLKGTLYYSNRLFDNAIIQFLKAKEKGFISEENYHYLADSYGSVGDDDKAVKIYEEAFSKLYPSRSMYEKMGWLYFKVRDNDKGIAVIKKGLARFQKSPGLLMLLGTLYSSNNNYQESKKYYLEAIDNSYSEPDSANFRSIVYYNLSLLEKSFLKYDDAYRTALVSLNWQDRSSPHTELNIIFQDSLELKKAYDEILKAISMPPETKFPHLSLVNLFLLCGKLNEAEKLTNELFNETDFSWMVYFGVTKEDYFAELYRYMSIINELKCILISYNEEDTFLNLIKRPFKKIYYTVSRIYYNYKSSNLFIKFGEENIKRGNSLEGLNNLYEGYEKVNSSKAFKVLRIANKIEEKSNPAKQKIYNIRKAIAEEKKDILYTNGMKRKVLEENIKLLDTRWEKELIAETLIELIKSSSGRERENYIEKLFITHAPFVALNDCRVNADFIFSGQTIDKNTKKKIINELTGRGFVHKAGSKIKFQIELFDNGKFNELLITNYYDNDYIKNFRIKIDKNEKKYYEKLGLSFFNSIFTVDLK